MACLGKLICHEKNLIGIIGYNLVFVSFLRESNRFLVRKWRNYYEWFTESNSLLEKSTYKSSGLFLGSFYIYLYVERGLSVKVSKK